MIRPLYADSWSSSSSEDEGAEPTTLDTYDVVKDDTETARDYMIHDVKIDAYNNQKIRLHLSLMDTYGVKKYHTIYSDVFFDVYIEALTTTENIPAILPQIKFFNNTPEYLTSKFTAMGYSSNPIPVWRLQINTNHLDTIYEFCNNRNRRRMFVNTDLTDALPMVQKNIGIYMKIPTRYQNEQQIPYSCLQPTTTNTLFMCRKLSLDIEVLTPEYWKLFPEATERGCEIIIIACTFQHNDEDYKTIVLYTDRKGRQHQQHPQRTFRHFNTEFEMLQHFIQLVTPQTVDILTGWNVRNFDLKYIYDRCTTFYPKLLEGFRTWSLNNRLPSFRDVTRKGQHAMLVDCFGILVLDMYDYNKSNVRAKSYKLKDIAARFLSDDKQKLSMDYTDISKFYCYGTDAEFAHLLDYCSVDAEIVLDLMAVQKVWNNTVCMADICHVPMDYVINHGVMLRNTCMISQFINTHTDYLLPYRHEHPFVEYEGGYVNDPIVGFHNNPIFVLDFNSLYPTTMLAFNICTTTLVHLDTDNFEPHTLNDLLFDDGTISATPYMQNVGFVRTTKRRGVMPQILDNLLKTRKRLQGELKKTTCIRQRQQLDAQQLSYKLCANAIYGLLGCSFSPLYNPEVAASVTGFGRFLSYVKRNLITDYMLEDGLRGRIVYGDTDSVMVEVCDKSVAETRQIALRYADRVTKDIGIVPIRTEYEKIFCPFLIHKKKHYIGVMYTDNCERHDKIEYKGNEMVRSDNCLLTTNVMRAIIDILFFHEAQVEDPQTSESSDDPHLCSKLQQTSFPQTSSSQTSSPQTSSPQTSSPQTSESSTDPHLFSKLKQIETTLKSILQDWSFLYSEYRRVVEANEQTKSIDRELVARVVKQAIYSKKLYKEVYKNRLPHVAVYERVRNSKQYTIGDRIVFCIANTELTDKIKPKNIIDMAYDTDELLQADNLFLAIHYYLDACLRKPLYRLFATLDIRFKECLESTLLKLFPPLTTKKLTQKRLRNVSMKGVKRTMKDNGSDATNDQDTTLTNNTTLIHHDSESTLIPLPKSKVIATTTSDLHQSQNTKRIKLCVAHQSFPVIVADHS